MSLWLLSPSMNLLLAIVLYGVVLSGFGIAVPSTTVSMLDGWAAM